MFGWLKRWRKSRAPSGVERRTSVRHACGLQVNDRLIISVGQSSWPAIVRDISTSGIGLVVGIRHDPGASLPIELFCTTNGYSRTVRAQIVRTQRLPDGYWFCGCCFDEQLGREELDALL